MKIGIQDANYTHYYGIAEGAKRAYSQGYECYDIGYFVNTDTNFFNLPEEKFKAEILKNRAIMESEGIIAWQVHSPWRYPPREGTPEEIAERLEQFLKAIRGAGYIGATHFVMHAIMPFGVNSGKDPEEQRNINAKFMKRLYEEAKAYGVRYIDIENLPFPAMPINNTTQCLEMAKRMNKETGDDVFKVCLDTGHANFCGENPAEMVRMLGHEYLGALHVHDNDGTGDQHLRPGLGNVDWGDFSNALREIGFEGCMSFETSVPRDIEVGEERDRLEQELANTGLKIAKRI